MKGICILMVIIVHCHVELPSGKLNNMFLCFRMPLYYFLSGLFFKEYGGMKDFVVRKVNKLVIPYLFFAIFPWIIADICCYNHSVSDVFWGILLPFNEPLWFLRSLFVTYIIYYAIFKICDKKKVIIGLFILCVVSVYGFYASQLKALSSNIIIRWLFQFDFFTAILGLPFFYIANVFFPYMKKINENGLPKKYLILLFTLFSFLWFFFSRSFIFYRGCDIGESFICFYLSAIGGIGTIWCLSYVLKKIPVISYIGRYSLIVLGCHYVLCVPMFHWEVSPWMKFLFVSIPMPAFIYVFKKYFPYFTAQKDIFRYTSKGLEINRFW